jgi:hypothetical protein
MTMFVLLRDTLIGAGMGTLVGKAVIRRSETAGSELSGPRVRHIDMVWTYLGGGLGFAASLIVRLASSL